MKLGAFLLLIGFGWLTSYAFINNWIGEIGRISFGLACGALILILGEYRIKYFKNQGAVLLGLGAAIILMTVFAAREIYEYFTPTSAVLLMSTSVIFIGVSSVKNKSLALAILCILLGAIAPFLTNANDPSFFSLFSYLLILSAGILWIVVITGWRVLTPITLTVYAVYSLLYLVDAYTDSDFKIAMIFYLIFAVLFYSVNIATILKNKEVKNVDIMTAGGNALLLLIWIAKSLPEEYKSLLTAFVACIFAVGAFFIFQRINEKKPMYIYSAIAIAMLAAATAFELKGYSLTIAYIVEIVSISVAAVLLLKDIAIGQKISYLFAFPIIFSLDSLFSNAWESGIIHKDFFVLLILASSLLFLGLFFYKYSLLNNTSNSTNNIYKALIIAGAAYFLAIIWLSLHAAVENQDTAKILALTIYTIIGLYFYVKGKISHLKTFYFSGGILLGIVIFRLFLVEIWDMDIGGKIIVFFLVGVLLISSAFIEKKYTFKE